MLDIIEFQEAKKTIIKNKDSINSLSTLKEYVKSLFLVSRNERSSEISGIIAETIKKAEKFNEHNLLFSLYWEYYLQTYYYVTNMKETKEILQKMQQISDKNNIEEQQSIVKTADSLLNQLLGENDKSFQYIVEAFDIISSYKNKYKETYYSTLYTYTLFAWIRERNINEAIENMRECVAYYYTSNNTLGMIKAIIVLLRFLIFSNQQNEIDKLLSWIFEEENIHEQIIDSHYTLLNGFIGTASTILGKIDDAIDYFSDTYHRIKNHNLETELMYEYTEIIRLLSRCYAYQGQFQESYTLLIELINFIEDDYVKDNFFARGKKIIYISSYFTLLFIFIQLNIEISDIKDKKLKQMYDYIKALLEKTPLSESLLMETSIDEKHMKQLVSNELERSREEVIIALQQLLLTHHPHKVSETALKTIKDFTITDYTYDPLYVDILLGKIYLAKGNFEKFKQIAKSVRASVTDTKVPLIHIWNRFFKLLSKYLEEPNNKTIVKDLIELEKQCEENNFLKLADEVKMYYKLISSSRTIKSFEDRFKQTAFIDVLNEQSKTMVLAYLD